MNPRQLRRRRLLAETEFQLAYRGCGFPDLMAACRQAPPSRHPPSRNAALKLAGAWAEGCREPADLSPDQLRAALLLLRQEEPFFEGLHILHLERPPDPDDHFTEAACTST